MLLGFSARTDSYSRCAPAALPFRKNDQARTMGPAEAVRAGASYIVVGRPIVAAADPRAVAETIVSELAGG